MLTIGLTGAIASGKSEVARLLAARGAVVVDADLVAHDVYRPDSDGYTALVSAFGPRIIGPDRAIDRRQLAAIVFADATQRRRLTDIVWPLTRRAVDAIAREQAAAGTRVLVVEAALLVEAGWQDAFDQVWLVRTSPANARRRLATRGLAPDDVEARLAAATDPALAKSVADVILDNDADLAALERAVDAAWRALPAA